MVKSITKKKYIPSSKEKYMCAKHKKFFNEELVKWKKDIIKANNLGNLLNFQIAHLHCYNELQEGLN